MAERVSGIFIEEERAGEYAESHECRTCRYWKLGKNCVLTECGRPCSCEVKASAAEVVTSLSLAGTYVPSVETRIGHRQGKDHWTTVPSYPPLCRVTGWSRHGWLATTASSARSTIRASAPTQILISQPLMV